MPCRRGDHGGKALLGISLEHAGRRGVFLSEGLSRNRGGIRTDKAGRIYGLGKVQAKAWPMKYEVRLSRQTEKELERHRSKVYKKI